MFDGISVSERTRKPWTVAVSFAGQGVMIGLAILVPLVSTEALPHGRFVSLLALPEPPPAIRPHVAVKVSKPTPVPLRRSVLQAPSTIPVKVATIVDPDLAPPGPSVEVGVPGGIGSPSGPGNAVIDSVVHAIPHPAPPPAVVTKEAVRPIPRIRQGGQVQLAKLISGPRPVYPPLAKQARIAGTVRLEAVIDRNGAIVDLRCLSGHPLLVPAAINAVQHWIFQPTYLNGEPVEVATEIEVNFKLQQ